MLSFFGIYLAVGVLVTGLVEMGRPIPENYRDALPEYGKFFVFGVFSWPLFAVCSVLLTVFLIIWASAEGMKNILGLFSNKPFKGD